MNEDGEHLSKIEIDKRSFTIKQYITGIHVLTINQHNLFGIEPATDFGGSEDDLSKECRFNGLVEPIPRGGQAMSLDFSFAEDCWLFGLPERNDEFAIQNTIGVYGSSSVGPDDESTTVVN